MGNVRIQIVHFGSIYAQKDSFAHRYGILEICGAFAVGFRLIRPGRPLQARSLPPARGGRLLRRRWAASEALGRWRLLRLSRWLVCGRWSAGLPVLRSLVLRALVRGRWALRLFVSAGTIVFFSPASPGGPGADPGGIVRTLRLQLPALRIYIPRRADSFDHRTQKKFVTK